MKKKQYNKRVKLTKDEIKDLVDGIITVESVIDKIPPVIVKKLNILDQCLDMVSHNKEEQDKYSLISTFKSAKRILVTKRKIKNCNLMDLEDIDVLDKVYDYIVKQSMDRSDQLLFKLSWN